MMRMYVSSCASNTGRSVATLFYLDDDSILDEKVDPVFAQETTFVVGGYFRLVNVLDASFIELNAHRRVIKRFEQPRPQVPMNLDSSRND